MRWSILIHLFLSMTLLSTMAKTQTISPEKKAHCLELLKEAVKSSDRFFVRVHAAEALVAHQHSEGLESLFSELQQASPDNFIGATRILAKVNRSNPAKYEAAVQQILNVFLHSEASRPRLVALESLGKLGYSEPLPQIQQQAQEGIAGMMPMARWVLANSGRVEDEARLAELLNSDDPLTYQYAAYALRFRPTIRPASYALLEACAARILPTAPARVYVLSALFVHTSPEKRGKIYALLNPYQQGEMGERYELAEALSLRGTPADIPTLEALLTDQDQDVQVAAANALLRINE